MKKTETPKPNSIQYLKVYKRNNRLRTLITVLFWLFVISTTIGLVLFSEGYSVSLDEQKITQNGALHIDSSPDGAVVYLNGKKRGQTPLSLPSVKPGDHKLEIIKTGFTSWSGDIYIQKKRAVEITATLFKSTKDIEKLTVKNIRDAHFSDRSNNMVFTVDNENETTSLYYRPFNYFIWDLNKQDTLVSTINSDSFDISVSPEGRFTLITSEVSLLSDPPVQDEMPTHYYLVRNSRNSELSEINLSFLDQIKKVAWPKGSETKLLIETENQILSYDVQTEQTILLLSFAKETTPVYTTTNLGNFIYINPTSKLPFSSSLEGKNKRALIDKNTKVNFIITAPTSIIPTDDESFYIVQDSDKFIYIQNSSILNGAQVAKTIMSELPSTIELGAISPDEKWIYYREEDKDLAVYRLDAINKSTAEEAGRSSTLLEAKLIEADQIFKWHPNSKDLITLPIRKNSTAAIKSINVVNKNIHTLYKGTLTETNFGVSTDGDRIIFILTEAGERHLYELDLLDNEVIKLGLVR